MSLLEHHRSQLRDESAIPDERIAARGYRSVGTTAELKRLGFRDYQARTPALLIPLYDVWGEQCGYALRPDEPRERNGKLVKYEMPAGRRQRLDVPPGCAPQLGDPSVPLYITEGAKKADALAGLGVCSISLNGVYAWRGTNKAGGKAALPDWESVALNGRRVLLAFDSDVMTKPQVHRALERLKKFLESREARVEIVYLPDAEDGRKQGVDDFVAAGGVLADLEGYATHQLMPVVAQAEDRRAEIVVSGRHLREISDDCWAVITEASSSAPFIFVRGGAMTRIDLDSTERPSLVAMDQDDLAHFLERECDFMKESKGGLVPARLPGDVAREMLATWDKPLPPIRGIVGTPTFTAEGALSVATGYQPNTELYYQPVGEAVPDVPVQPSEEEVGRAKSLLFDEWLVDFPFANQASCTHAIGVALTPIVRELIEGPTPLFAIDAPTPGTGKGLLAETLGILVYGGPPPVMSELGNDEELRKRITALLIEGGPIVLFDNINRPVQSGVLAALLTADTWSDRLLGVTQTIRAPNRATWMMTGNNLDLSNEIARRTVWLRIDPNTDRPWERSGFRHYPLSGWVRSNRHELLWALLVLAQHWIAVGRPAWSGKPMGTFEAWCQVVGGILEQAGIEGFLANRDELFEKVDSESDEWRAFLAAWWELHRSNPVAVADLAQLIADHDHLPTVFGRVSGDAADRSLRTKLGQALRKHEDRWFADLRIVGLGRDPRAKVHRYRLQHRSAVPRDEGLAEVPPRSDQDSRADAGPAGPAGPLFNLFEESVTTPPTGERPIDASASGDPDQVPQVPQVPRSQQPMGDPDAGPAGRSATEVTQRSRQPGDSRDREPCPGGCGTPVPAGQKCPGCAARAVASPGTQGFS